MTTPDNNERRQTAERRNPTARRRHAETRKVHIELCQSVLRVAVVVAGDPDKLPTLRTRSVTWRRDAPNLLCDLGRTELTAALQQLVSEERLAGCGVSLAISSTLCVNRATSGAIAKVEHDIADLQDRSQLYVALGPGPKTTAVGRKLLDARHEHALLTVTNEQTLDLLVDAAESAGLVIKVVESALVALSRLHGRLESKEAASVILAQLDENRFEIGVCRQGELLLEYRPSASTTLAQLGEVVDGHFERLKRFCSRQYGVGQADLDRMWLVGDPNEIRAANSKTKQGIEAAVLPLERLGEFWRVEDTAPVSAAMGAALGLALRGRFEESGVSPNLMEQINARAKTPVRPFLLRAAAPVAATLLVASSIWLVNLQRQTELSALRSRVEAAMPSQLQGKRLTRMLADATNEIKNLTQLQDQTPETQISPIVKRVGQCLPDDVWLKAFRLSALSELYVTGASYTEGGVYDFVRYLDEAPTFSEVALRGTGVDQTPQGPATSFDLDLNLDQAPATPAPTEPKR